MNARVRAALVLARAMIESDRDVTTDAWAVTRDDAPRERSEEAEVLAEYDTVLAEIDAVLKPVPEAAWQRDGGRVTVTISGRRGSGKTACAHLFREAVEAIGVEALVLDECDVTHARMEDLRPKVVIRVVADDGQTGGQTETIGGQTVAVDHG